MGWDPHCWVGWIEDLIDDITHGKLLNSITITLLDVSLKIYGSIAIKFSESTITRNMIGWPKIYTANILVILYMFHQKYVVHLNILRSATLNGGDVSLEFSKK